MYWLIYALVGKTSQEKIVKSGGFLADFYNKNMTTVLFFRMLYKWLLHTAITLIQTTWNLKKSRFWDCPRKWQQFLCLRTTLCKIIPLISPMILWERYSNNRRMESKQIFTIASPLFYALQRTVLSANVVPMK